MKRPKQRAPKNWRAWPDIPLYFLDEPADFRFEDRYNRGAVPLHPEKCGFARCWKGLGYPAQVFRTYTYVNCGDFAFKAKTTQLMQRQITANDQGAKIAPGDYRLGRIPPSGRKPRTKGKVRGGGGGNPPPAQGPDLVRPRAVP